MKEEKERKKWSGACVGTRWHDLEGRGRVQARLPLCLTDLETARFAIACDSIGPHATRLIRGTKNCPPRHESYPPYVEFCKWNFPVSGGNILPTGVQRIGFPQFLFFSFFSLFLFDDSFNERSFSSCVSLLLSSLRSVLVKRFEGEVEFMFKKIVWIEKGTNFFFVLLSLFLSFFF